MFKTIAAVALAAVLALVGSVPANADAGADARFPKTAPDWYNTAPSAPYVPNAMPIHFASSSKGAVYYGLVPTGGAPYAWGDPYDFEVMAYGSESYLRFTPPTDLQGQLRTDLVAAFLVDAHRDDPYCAWNPGVCGNVRVGTDRNVLYVYRPVAGCSLSYTYYSENETKRLDPTDYDITVAYLGANGHKYVAKINVTFSVRSLNCQPGVSASMVAGVLAGGLIPFAFTTLSIVSTALGAIGALIAWLAIRRRKRAKQEQSN